MMALWAWDLIAAQGILLDPIEQESTYVGDPDATPRATRPVRIRKKRRGVALIPSMFTLGNCLMGFLSLNFASRGIDSPTPALGSNYTVAGYFIFLAMVFDMFDGFVARLTRSSSDFGAELDSLADMVSFGIAPAFLSLHLIADLLQNPALNPNGRDFFNALPGPFSDSAWMRLFWAIAAIYVCCTALRLARFNVLNQHDVLSHMSFRGMPSPGAAAVVASTVIFFEYLRRDQTYIPFNVSPAFKDWLKTVFPYLLPLMLLFAALLMVSRFSYAHIINRFFRGRKKFRRLVGLFLLVMIIVWQPALTAIIAIYLYALSAPVSWLYRKATRKPLLPSPPPPPLSTGAKT
jgi:CDP-diacylglycerol--serine O-phosphatidyltransferase